MKKILSWLMVLCLMVGMVPLTASAEEKTVKTVDDLKTAISNSSQGDVIKLEEDIVIDPTDGVEPGSTKLEPALTVLTDLTIDLNGYSISWDTSKTATNLTFTPVFLSVNGANVTITGQGSMDAEAGNNTSYCINVINNGSLTIESGDFKGAMTIAQVQTGTISILNGTFDLSTTIKKATNDEFSKYLINAIDKNWSDGSAKVIISGGSFWAYDYYHNSPEITGPSYVADGYTCTTTPDENGMYTVSPKTEQTEEDVAVVNGQYFTQLQSAIEAARNGKTVKLLKNNHLLETVTIQEDDNLIFDLNGYEITVYKNEETGRSLYAIDNYGTLTLMDSGGTGKITARGVQNLGDGNLTINSGTIVSCNENGGAAVWNEASVVINGGTFETVHVGSPSDNVGVGCLNNQGTALITGGTFTDVNRRTYAIISTGNLEITPSNGSNVIVNGAHGGVSSDAGTLVINGGTFTSSDFYGLYVSNDGAEGNPEKAAVTVNGGIFNGKEYAVWVGSDVHNPVNSIVAIFGGDFQKPLNAQNNTLEGAIQISGGYFTSNPSEYVAEGMAAVESDKEGYAYMVAKAGETPAEVVPADPSVDTNLSVSEEDEKELLESIITSLGGSTPPSLDADSLNAAALTVANSNTTKVDDDLVDDLKKAIGGNVEIETNDVTIVIQPYMDIKVTDVNSDGDQKSFTLDITPMYRKVAVKNNDDGNVPDDIVTKADVEGETSSNVNAVVVGEPQELKVNQPTKVVIPLPTDFTTDNTLYVLHDNRHYHQGTVDSSNVLTFTTEGFSPFTISTSAEMAAQIGDVYYDSLQDAVDNVQNGETIVLLKDQESATVDREVSFTISTQSSSPFTASISAGAGYRNVGTGNSYRFERIPSTPVNPGGGDDDKPEEPTFPFTDVKSTAWYYNAVKYVYENDLMVGTSATTFEPELKLNRAMAAQILYNLEGQPAVTGTTTFTDADDAGAWAVKAITWAEQNDVVAGIGGGLFNPTGNVTREAFAQMMYNYAKYKKYDLTKTGDLTEFLDADTISDWAETAMSWANGNGLINGHEDTGRIDPQGSTTRAQAASIIMNFDKNIVK